jgi:2-oxoglutarate dehydrogenase E2 component (dihydrolipoamide succinyltransferase)
MQIEIKVPQLSESVTEATLLAWRKQPGEAAQEGENLIDIETDKVVLETPAPKSGVLVKILKQEGEKVGSGEVLALLDTEPAPKAVAAPAPVAAATPAPAPGPGPGPGPGPAAVTPSARRAAREADVDASQLAGSGRHGAVTRQDVLAAAEKPTAAVLPAAGRTEQRVPMTRIRQRIAERLLESQRNAAILTTFNEVNMQPVMDLRARYKDVFEKKHGVKLGFSSFFVKAAVSALQQFPVVNASIDETDVIYHGYYDIGVAIGSERGLVVPIIRDADKLSMADIEKQIADFAARAKTGKLTMEELSGGTFSITNGGVFGSMLSTPIINPPQSAILGIHATKDRPVAENGQVVIRPMNYLALSYDHRIIDGRDAVLFLVVLKEALEYPGRILLDV